jgi:hypothetical protein
MRSAFSAKNCSSHRLAGMITSAILDDDQVMVRLFHHFEQESLVGFRAETTSMCLVEKMPRSGNQSAP